MANVYPSWIGLPCGSTSDPSVSTTSLYPYPMMDTSVLWHVFLVVVMPVVGLSAWDPLLFRGVDDVMTLWSRRQSGEVLVSVHPSLSESNIKIAADGLGFCVGSIVAVVPCCTGRCRVVVPAVDCVDPSALHVAGPATPSEVRLCCCWHCRSASCVWDPKTPSAVPERQLLLMSNCCKRSTLEPRAPWRNVLVVPWVEVVGAPGIACDNCGTEPKMRTASITRKDVRKRCDIEKIYS